MKFIKALANFITLSIMRQIPTTSSQSLTSSRPVTSPSGAAFCAVGDWLTEFAAQHAAGGACIPLAAQCGWACSKTENCSYFNSWTDTGRCQLFADGTFNATLAMNCTLYEKVGHFYANYHCRWQDTPQSNYFFTSKIMLFLVFT